MILPRIGGSTSEEDGEHKTETEILQGLIAFVGVYNGRGEYRFTGLIDEGSPHFIGTEATMMWTHAKYWHFVTMVTYFTILNSKP